MGDLVLSSDQYEFRPTIQRDFRRACTIKLPLPSLEGENVAEEDIVIMQLSNEGVWDLLDVPLKLTKNLISFDTKSLRR